MRNILWAALLGASWALLAVTSALNQGSGTNTNQGAFPAFPPANCSTANGVIFNNTKPCDVIFTYTGASATIPQVIVPAGTLDTIGGAGLVFGAGNVGIVGVNSASFDVQVAGNANPSHSFSRNTHGDISVINTGCWFWASGGNSEGTPDTSLCRNAAGVVDVGTSGTPNALGSLQLAGIAASGSIINTGIASDATHTDTTVCQDTTSHTFLAGSGTAGICLGSVSSIRFKDAWTPLNDSLSTIMALKPGTWRYKPGIADGGKRLQVGFLAEDYARALPDWTRYDEHGRPNGDDIVAVVPQLVRAIQQLKSDNDNLRTEIDRLKTGRR